MDTGWVQKLQQELKRQRAMLRPSEVGFVKPSINYGSVAGSSAKFFGQGILNMKKGASAPAETGPFSMRVVSDGNIKKIAVQPGTINGLLFEKSGDHIEGKLLSPNGTGFVILNCMSDGKVITQATLTTDSNFKPAAPTKTYPPFSFKWPLAYFVTKGTGANKTVSLYSLIGKSSLVAFAAETARIPRESTNPGQSFYDIYYTWVVSNSTDPIFITIES